MSTPIKQTEKDWIDNATYEQLLYRLRFSPAGDEMFVGDTGRYFSEVMKAKGVEIGHESRVQASKRIGWKA
jgi:hypothetical protein